MRTLLVIPILILAVMAGVRWAPSVHAPEPVTDTALSGATPGLQSARAYLLPVANPAYAPVRDSRVVEPELDANVGLLMHLESGRVLFEKNRTIQVPVASLTKLLSALVVRDLLDGEAFITVASTSIRVDGQKQTLYQDERIRVRDLVAMMLVESSNDAAYALAAEARAQGHDFIARMNEKAGALGMDGCKFTDPAGLDDSAYCTADAMMRLARASLRQAPELWSIMAQPRIQVASADGRITHDVASTNELLGLIGGIIGGKTGNTDGALGCMLLAVQAPDGRGTLVSVILGSRSRFGDTRTLIEWAGTAYRWQ
jgi:D-alanyl-D-alanine carboxypeptidase